jgi:alpha-tubulin suppressor-like RCC1 family protein
MVNYICTRFKDSDGLDLGCHLIPKEYLLEKYPALQEWVKAPALWSWGQDITGSLGTGVGGVFRSSPVQTVSNGTNWRRVATSNSHSAGIKTDGALWLWGNNSVGQLGRTTTVNASSPVQTISGGTNWRIAAVAASHSAAIKTDSSLWLWGLNSYGQLGDNSALNKSSPVQTIAAGNNWQKISVGPSTTASIKTDGTLWVWGRGLSGRLGNSAVTNRSSPVQTFAAGNNWKDVSTNSYHTVAIKTDGTLWTWGANVFGQLGNNANGNLGSRSSPVQTFSAGTNWKQASAGFAHTAAIKTDGSLWVWGYNTAGELGNSSIIAASSPTQTVSSGTNWSCVSAGYYHTVAIKTDGTLWSWGGNSTGQLGDNSRISKSSPVQTISAGTNWRIVSAGRYQTAAICNEGDY